MWALTFVPDAWLQYVVHAVLALGVSLFVAGTFSSFIPFISQYGRLVKVAGVVVIIIGIFFEGSYVTEMQWRNRVAELQAKIKVAEAKSAKANEELSVKLKESSRKIQEVQNANQILINTNRAVIDSQCRVPDIAIRLHNDASQNVVSSGSRRP